MKDSKDPRAARNSDHMDSKVVVIAANVFSILSSTFLTPGGTRCERDVIGGGFNTFSPHPRQ